MRRALAVALDVACAIGWHHYAWMVAGEATVVRACTRCGRTS